VKPARAVLALVVLAVASAACANGGGNPGGSDELIRGQLEAPQGVGSVGAGVDVRLFAAGLSGPRRTIMAVKTDSDGNFEFVTANTSKLQGLAGGEGRDVNFEIEALYARHGSYTYSYAFAAHFRNDRWVLTDRTRGCQRHPHGARPANTYCLRHGFVTLYPQGPLHPHSGGAP